MAGRQITSWGQMFGEFQISHGVSGIPPTPSPGGGGIGGGPAMGPAGGRRPQGPAELAALFGWQAMDPDDLIALLAILDDEDY